MTNIFFPVIGAPDPTVQHTNNADGSTGSSGDGPGSAELSTLYYGSQGAFIYGVAGSTITAGQFVTVDNTGSANPITKALAQLGWSVGVANSAVATGDYAWFQVSGILSGNALTGVAGGAPVYTTATAGALSETATSEQVIHGLVFTAANSSGSTAVTAAYAATSMHAY